MKSYQLLNSLTIKERGELNLTNFQTFQKDEWFSRKSLLKKKDIENMISEQYKGMNNFIKGLSDFKPQIECLELEWFDDFESKLNKYKHERIKDIDITYSFRFYISDMRELLIKKIRENKTFKFDDEFLMGCLQGYVNDIIEVVYRCITDDLHRFKETKKLKSKNSKERYKEYLIAQFTDKNSIKDFYYRHPALVRLLFERTLYFKKNISTLFNRMDKTFKKYLNTLNVDSDKILSIRMGQGDTHNKGNSVSIIKVDESTKVVYKPKSLKIYNSIDRFMQYSNRNLKTDFYIPQRLVKEEYVFEEFITRKGLRCEEEAKEYYYNYGNLLGLVYLLNGNDIHYENIIAYGKHPVIIDMETFIQEPIPINTGTKDATYHIKEDYIMSVRLTGMLPFKTLTDRSEDKKEGVDVSALSQGNIKTPFNVLQVVNQGTDEMKFEYNTHSIPSANNVPILGEENVPYIKYKDYIKKGLENFLRGVLKNKQKIYILLKEGFSNINVRHVIRPTQRYSDLLGFSYHPNGMKNMKEREYVLQNLWSTPYEHTIFSKYEYEELLHGDIPQFFLNTSTTSLYSNDFDEISNVFTKKPIDIVLNKCINLNEQVIEEQLLHISLSFKDYNPQIYQSYKGKVNNSNIKNVIEEVVDHVSNQLLRLFKYDENTNTINYKDICNRGEWELAALNDNLYDGLPGIYLFMVAHDYFKKNKTFSPHRTAIINTLNNLPSKRELNPFFGKLSIVYPLLAEYKLLGNKESLILAESYINDSLSGNMYSGNDWIAHSIGLIPILLELNNIKGEKTYENITKKIYESITLPENSDNIGFAHGMSNIYYIDYLLGKMGNDNHKNIFKQEDAFLYGGHKKNETNGWCKGKLSIILSRVMSHKYTISNKTLKEVMFLRKDNTLCHGNSALLELLIQLKLKDSSLLDAEQLIRQMLIPFYKNKRLNVQQGVLGESLGLFTGQTGVAYQLMRYLDESIPNVLFFEL